MTPKERARFGVGLSPRGRRHPPGPRPQAPTFGSISAWAEAPKPSDGSGTASRVYLRVGGGTATAERFVVIWRGLSPRGRRHQDLLPRLPGVVGSISAWAEAPAATRPSVTRPRVYLRVGGGTPLSFCHGPPGNRAIHRDRGSFPVRTSQVSLLFAHGSTPVLFGPAPTTPASAAPHPRAWRSPDGR